MPAFGAMVETFRLRERDDRHTFLDDGRRPAGEALSSDRCVRAPAIMPNGVLVQYSERIEVVRLNPQGLGSAPRPAMEAAA